MLARGGTKCSVRLLSGLLHHFTGSKPHNIAIRLLGVQRHLKINEYGVFRGKGAEVDTLADRFLDLDDDTLAAFDIVVAIGALAL